MILQLNRAAGTSILFLLTVYLLSCSSDDRAGKTAGNKLSDQTEVVLTEGPVRLEVEKVPYPHLSDYAFFTGRPADLQPNARVIPYELITPLFTDYAHKARFVWMPAGAQASVDAMGKIQFPDRTVLIKNFFYPADFRQPEEKQERIETRLLVKRNGNWEAFSYVWNEAQTDARLKNTGAIREVSWTDLQGFARKIDYVVPNKNQCKSCHHRDNVILPIGPTVRNLQKKLRYPDGRAQNQLVRWQQEGLLPKGSYPDPPLPDWADKDQPLEARALAYLDVNCGHCHRPDGSAKTTGMFLNWEEKDPAKWGRCKPPVAAGRGSGGKDFGILPGNPAQSILVHRMESKDPGVMMPELGRVTPHTEGIALIREWIGKMAGACE